MFIFYGNATAFRTGKFKPDIWSLFPPSPLPQFFNALLKFHLLYTIFRISLPNIIHLSCAFLPISLRESTRGEGKTPRNIFGMVY